MEHELLNLAILFEADYGEGTITAMYGAEGDEVDSVHDCITFIAYMHTGEYAGQLVIDDMGDCIAIPVTKH
jgi:hypothetical protein